MKQKRVQRWSLFLKTVWMGLFCVLWMTGCSSRPQIRLSGIYEETETDDPGRSTLDTEKTVTEAGAEGRALAPENLMLPTESSGLEGFQTEEWQTEEFQTEEILTESRIMVYVCGAVRTPGVYSLPENSRVYEAVQEAGGFLTQADQEWVNQAGILQDGQKLKIYTLEETKELEAQGSSQGQIPESGTPKENLTEAGAIQPGKVKLNTASKEELMTLPGIGESKAEAVIRHREEQGKFQTIEDIMQISGIKDAVFAKIKDRITV